MWRLLQGSSPLLCNLREDSFEAIFVNSGVCIKTPACSSPPLSQSHVKSEIRPEISGFSFLRCQGLQVSQPILCHVSRGVTRHNVNIVTAVSSLRLHLNWDQLGDKAHFSLHRTQFWYSIAEDWYGWWLFTIWAKQRRKIPFWENFVLIKNSTLSGV